MAVARYRIQQVRIGLDDDEATIRRRLARLLGCPVSQLQAMQCVRRAIDARNKRDVHFNCQYEVELGAPLRRLPEGVAPFTRSRLTPETPAIFRRTLPADEHVVIVGAGPAGLFAALALAEVGCRVTLLERGKPVESRMRDIGRLRARGALDPESNICFGEGGAGTYTDGKLYTRIKHPFVRHVLHQFVRFGADPDILVDAHPHLGTDKLVRIVRRMRNHLCALGVDYRFETRVDGLLTRAGKAVGVRTHRGEEIRATHVILAIGHSARDTFDRLLAQGIAIEPKPFAVGVRAEHPQALINRIQHGRFAAHPRLGAAEYRLTHQVADPHLGRRGVYSFCMCPGGLIVPSPTEPGAMAINGMSNAKRAGRWANAGIVVQLEPADLERHGLSRHPLIGIAFQRELERATFAAAGDAYAAPAMRISDFVARRASGTLAPTRFKPNAVPTDLHALMPAWLSQPLVAGVRAFDRKMRGFITEEANLLAMETRTSAPVRLPRDETTMQSVSLARLYPIGEGAGYAGGIVSAAVDGLKAAARIIDRHATAPPPAG
ncbi:MAG: FAD-dependent oxidoreductase [Zetaproteobacteria bacterium]|nr:MAG: FAD-dependent oxidoreductase [Zetaproteobacteria bacterium]